MFQSVRHNYDKAHWIYKQNFTDMTAVYWRTYYQLIKQCHIACYISCVYKICCKFLASIIVRMNRKGWGTLLILKWNPNCQSLGRPPSCFYHYWTFTCSLITKILCGNIHKYSNYFLIGLGLYISMLCIDTLNLNISVTSLRNHAFS